MKRSLSQSLLRRPLSESVSTIAFLGLRSIRSTDTSSRLRPDDHRAVEIVNFLNHCTREDLVQAGETCPSLSEDLGEAVCVSACGPGMVFALAVRAVGSLRCHWNVSDLLADASLYTS